MTDAQTLTDLWQCDGCSITGTLAEVEAHVIAVNTGPDGELIDMDDAVCWGAMQVGGPAWEDYTFHGVHPMRQVLHSAQIIAMEFGIEPDE